MEFKPYYILTKPINSTIHIDTHHMSLTERNMIQESLFALGYEWIAAGKEIIYIGDVAVIQVDPEKLIIGITFFKTNKPKPNDFAEYFKPNPKYIGLHSSIRLGL